ncbi:hypothetical protein WOC76_13380 [Methylocystis sp. IM3]|uniref:hypothetical protein n=1 Tax=unclassified Methylocystis TaxID=2625913 RepID=UPI0030FA86E7
MKKKGRSRVTNARVSGRINARALFVGEIDGRSLWARRYRDLVCAYVDDAGGVHALSELRLSLIRRVAALTVEAERLEVDLASGREVDVDLLARLSSHIRRIAETIGLDRAVKDITPSLSDIVAQHAAPSRRLADTPKARAATILEADPSAPLYGPPEPNAEAE